MLSDEDAFQFATAFLVDSVSQHLVGQLPDVELEDEDYHQVAELARKYTLQMVAIEGDE